MKKINLAPIFYMLLIVQIMAGGSYKINAKEKETLGSQLEQLSSTTIKIGNLKSTNQTYEIDGISIPVYSCENVSYIFLADLKQLGANIAWDKNTKKTIIYDLTGSITKEPDFETVDNIPAFLGRHNVYFNYQEVPAIFAQNKWLIPLKWVKAFADMDNITSYNVINNNPSWDIEKDIPEIIGINIWFDGENYIEEEYRTTRLGKYGYSIDYDKEDALYIGYIIKEVDGIVNNDVDFHKDWLKNPTYYTVPKVEEDKEELFPATIVKGTMKYTSEGLSKGKHVIINRADSGKFYFIEGENNIIKVPWDSVSIQNNPVSKERATKEQIEDHINNLDITSRTNYLVWTDLYRQRTYVFKGSKGNWALIRDMLSSSGRDITPTPRGKFTLHTRVPAFGYGKGYLAKNAYAFIGTEYLYHSVLYDQKGEYLLEGRGVLGTKASQGCIRFSPEDSIWFYKEIPIGTRVYIN